MRYWFDRTMSKGTPALIGWLGLASVALGYRLTARFHEPPGYGVVLNPDKAAPLTPAADDRVIVLAEN